MEDIRFINGNNTRDRRLRETVASLGGVQRFGSNDDKKSVSYDEYLKDGICDFTCNGTYPGNFPYFTILITIAQIGTFGYYYNTFSATDVSKFNPYTKCGHLIISPYHQTEVWRIFLYQFNHAGWSHLLSNCAVQIILGSILELVHGSWRLLLLYFSGVILGGLFAMALSPGTFLVGASGGDYALIFAFLANVIINWNSMTGDLSSKIRWIRFSFVTCWLLFDIGTLIYRLSTSKVSHVSWQAHMGGGVAGITLGLLILWNPKPLKWEITLKWIGLAIYIIVMFSVILAIVFHPKPKSYRRYDPPCSLFRLCKQMNAAFKCSSMTTREQSHVNQELYDYYTDLYEF